MFKSLLVAFVTLLFSSGSYALILSGQRTENWELPFKHSVVSVIAVEKDGNETLYSGVVIEGCVLTLGSAVRKEMIFLGGTNLYDKDGREELGVLGEAYVLGKSGKQNLAVLKPKGTLPKRKLGGPQKGSPFSIIAKEKFKGTEHQSRLFAIGWGHRETALGEIVTEGKAKLGRVDTGDGVKHFGKCTFAGSKDGIMFLNRANSAQGLTEGDLGGPLFTVEGEPGKGKTVQLYALGAKIKTESLTREKPKAEDSVGSAAVELAPHRKWIESTLKKAGCL